MPTTPQGRSAAMTRVTTGAAVGAAATAAMSVLMAGWRSSLGGGLSVWAGAYGRTLPALGSMPAPSQDRPGRQPRLVVAHIVYGAVLGALCDHRRATGGGAWT